MLRKQDLPALQDQHKQHRLSFFCKVGWGAGSGSGTGHGTWTILKTLPSNQTTKKASKIPRLHSEEHYT